MPLSRFFSARHEFPSQWYAFFNPGDPAADQTLALTLDADRFPFFTQGRKLVVDGINLYARVTTSGLTYDAVVKDTKSHSVNFTLNAGNQYFAAPDPASSVAGFDLSALQITLRRDTVSGFKSLPEADIDDLYIVINYHLA